MAPNIKKYMKSVGINFYTTQNQETKAAIAERVIRTLKSKIFRYMAYNNTKSYIKALPDIVSAYNNTKNRYGFKPIEVTSDNAEKIKRKLFPKNKSKISFSFPLGTYVRIGKSSNIFARGYNEQWSNEIFKIKKQIATVPPVYEIDDLNDERILGRFYKEELQEVALDQYFKIEKILEKRKSKRSTDYYVKWYGYPRSMNSWVSEHDLKTI